MEDARTFPQGYSEPPQSHEAIHKQDSWLSPEVSLDTDQRLKYMACRPHHLPRRNAIRWGACRAEGRDMWLCLLQQMFVLSQLFSKQNQCLTPQKKTYIPFNAICLLDIFLHIWEFGECIQLPSGILLIFACLRADLQTKINTFFILTLSVVWRGVAMGKYIAGKMRTASKFLSLSGPSFNTSNPKS